MSKFYIGILSGISADSIDAVLVDFVGNEPKVVAHHKAAWSRGIQMKLRKLMKGGSLSLAEFATLDQKCGSAFAEAVDELVKKSKVAKSKIMAIGSYGQTVYHHSSDDCQITMQIGDPNVIASQTSIPVVADFGRSDVALGGKGSPLTSGFCEYWLRDNKGTHIVANIGAISSVTLLPKAKNAKLVGFDLGPGTVLLDSLARQTLKKSFDKDGAWAAGGEVNEKLLKAFLGDYYFQRSAPKSTGSEYFNLAWVRQKMRIAHVTKIKSQDLAATILELSARLISDMVAKYARQKPQIVLAGGGVYNTALVERIEKLCEPLSVVSTQEFGVQVESLGALTFAWMAKNYLEGKPSNVPGVTGAAGKAVLGGLYKLGRVSSN